MKDDQVSFKLVGAPTYNTLVQAFCKGTVYVADRQVWEEQFKDETHPVSGNPMFAEASDDEDVAQALEDTGLAGVTTVGSEVDTGAALASTDLSNIPDGSDLSDLDDDADTAATAQATADAAAGAQTGAEGSVVVGSDPTPTDAPSTAAAAPEVTEPVKTESKTTAPAARKMTVGGGKRN